MTNTDIQGRWEIVAWVQNYDDGRIIYPMGQDVEGFIEYGQYGMFCIISAPNRPSFTSGGQWDANDSEKGQAYGSYLCYSGDYQLEDNVVTHHVKHSLFPNWEGGKQRRQISWTDDGLLSLTARLEDGTSEARTAKLVWKRLSPHTTA